MVFRSFARVKWRSDFLQDEGYLVDGFERKSGRRMENEKMQTTEGTEKSSLLARAPYRIESLR
jgi:hypothetical protein